MSGKRNDLQGIRGIAILLVLVFHLKPNLFPYGFIGVDMFFVLSGFLMTMILSKKLMNAQVLVDFYTRRFKRIVSLFVCILTAVYLVGWFYLVDIDRVQLLTDLKWSLSFTSNVQPLFEVKGYWDQYIAGLWVWKFNFYVIAPFVVGYCRQKKWNYLVYALLVFLFCFQILSPPRISYGMLPSRIWQFLCGTVAYEIEKITTPTKIYGQLLEDKFALIHEATFNIHLPIRSTKFTIIRELLAISLIVVVFLNPQFIGETGMRIFGTFVTTAFICSSNFAVFSFLSSKILVYIGDISYTLYLVHWPTIVFYKYYHSLIDLSVIDIMWCASVMFVLSIVFHHTLEDFLVRTQLLQASLIFFGCILFIIFTSPFYEKDIQFLAKPDSSQSELIATAIRINAEEDSRQAQEANVNDPSKNYFWVPCHRDFESEKWTNWTVEPQLRCVTKSNGTLNVLVMGNSIAYRAFPTIHNLFKGRFNTMRLLSKSSLPGIYSSKNSRPESQEYETAMKALVENFKPDIIFVVFTTIISKTTTTKEGLEIQAPVTDFKTDKVMQHLQRNFDFYGNYSRKIVVDLPYYINTGMRFAQEINKRLTLGKHFDDLKVTREVMIVILVENGKDDIEKLASTTVILFIYTYDRKTFLSILSDGIHLTQAGLRRVKKQYSDIVEKVIEELN